MTVLVFGISGVKKGQVLDRLAKYYTSQHPGTDVFTVDIKDSLRTPMATFLAMPLKSKRTVLEKAVHDCVRIVEQSKAPVKFVSLHATYFGGGELSAPLSVHWLALLSPDRILTLVDDAYAIRARIAGEGYDIPYTHLLFWRAADLMLVDNFADRLTGQMGKQIENQVIAVKHPLLAFYRLLFEPRRPRIYCGFHVTHVRTNSTAKNEINEFRRKLQQEYLVFDPLTVDDRILVNFLRPRLGSRKVTIPSSERWDWRISDDPANPLSPMIDDEQFFPLRVNVGEARMLASGSQPTKSIIDAQITSRDFRYIDQADVMVAFRPWWSGETSIGVETEMGYAQQHEKGPIIYSVAKDEEKYTVKHGTSVPLKKEVFGPRCYVWEAFDKKLRETCNAAAATRCENNGRA